MKTALLVMLNVMLLSSACKKNKTVTDSELYGTWRVDSFMNISSQVAYAIDTIYFNDPPNKRLKFEMKENGSIYFEYNNQAPFSTQGEGYYTLQEYKTISAKVFRTDYGLYGSKWTYNFLLAMNEAESYSIVDNRLTVFFDTKMMKCSKE